MKKIMVMFLMAFAAMFASPLFALDESPQGVKTFNSPNDDGLMHKKNVRDEAGAANADDVTYVKVDVLHKDTLIHKLDNKIGKQLPEIGSNKVDTFATIKVGSGTDIELGA